MKTKRYTKRDYWKAAKVLHVCFGMWKYETASVRLANEIYDSTYGQLPKPRTKGLTLQQKFEKYNAHYFNSVYLACQIALEKAGVA